MAETRLNRSAKALEEAVDEDRLAHAILLYGDSLPSLKDTALKLASKLLKTPDPEKHPDLLFLTPRGKSRQISIGSRDKDEPNTVRSLIHDINMTPVLASRKVAVIEDVDRFNKSAANAFLKTLEEPPQNTTLFLLTTRPYDLLATIRSRCLMFRMSTDNATLNDETWQKWLADYSHWVSSLQSEKTTKRNAAQYVMTAYGLSMRFNSVLNDLHDTAWSHIKEDSLPQDDDQSAALKAGLMKSTRKQMLSEIQSSTRNLVCNDPSKIDANLTRKLSQNIDTLEQSYRLLDRLNFNADAALEHFLLRSLQIWAS